MLLRTVSLVLLSASIQVQADTAHYYRFEADPGFLVDSTGNADLTTNSESEWALPGSAGRGSNFPKGFGSIDPEKNRAAAEFFLLSIDAPSAPLQALSGSFTVEFFARFDTLAGSFGTVLVADALGRDNGEIAWLLDVRRDGFAGSQTNELQLVLCASTTCSGVNSGYVLEAGTDYYIAAVYDGPNNAVTFWLDNLDSAGGLQSNTINQSLPTLNTIGVLTIAALDNTAGIDGIIDELRISDTLLGENELLASNTNIDVDEDSVSNDSDNCIFVANEDQLDANGDHYGNACDADLNNDCIVNAADLGLFKQVFFTTDANSDFNGDGIVNAIDLGVLKGAFFAFPGPSGLPNACDGT